MPHAIEVRDLHKKYKNTKALRGLDFTIPTGAITGFLGPNGAGKTTTFRSLLGLTRFDRGEVSVLGHKIPKELKPVTKKVGAIIEEPGMIRALTGRTNLKVAAETLGFGFERIEPLLEFVSLEDDAGRKVGEYSKGMRQRLALAGALLGDPELLLLDEPLDGLDPAGQKSFRARLRDLADEGRTIVVSSHVLADIEALADEVVVIDHGKLVAQGTLESMLGERAIRVEGVEVSMAAAVLRDAGLEVQQADKGLLVMSEDGAQVVRALANAGIYPSAVIPARNSLEQVFLGMTGDGS